jgi:hypothetical protein
MYLEISTCSNLHVSPLGPVQLFLKVESEKSKLKDCTAKIDMLSSSIFFFQPTVPSALRSKKSKVKSPKTGPTAGFPCRHPPPLSSRVGDIFGMYVAYDIFAKIDP